MHQTTDGAGDVESAFTWADPKIGLGGGSNSLPWGGQVDNPSLLIQWQLFNDPRFNLFDFLFLSAPLVRAWS